MKPRPHLIAAALIAIVAAACSSPQRSSSPVAAAPLQRLMDGNQRFVSGKPEAHYDAEARRVEFATKQNPFAVIVSCSDSRVGPEVVFDQSVGDIFVVRNAGEVVDDVALGSIEYAVKVLGAELIMVLGHSRCGAVDAALAGKPVPGHISAVVDAIAPALNAAPQEPGDALNNAIRANVRYIMKRIETNSSIVQDAMREGRLTLVGATYELESGAVTVLPAK